MKILVLLVTFYAGFVACAVRRAINECEDECNWILDKVDELLKEIEIK